MNKYEKLLDEYSDLSIIENYHFNDNCHLKGLYCDGFVALSDALKTTAERSCILAEEIGHHETTSGNILEINNINNSKQERFARIWAYKKLVSLNDFITAFEKGCRFLYEFAEYLDVTEEFLLDSLNYYKQKYGTYKAVGDYIFMFAPHFDIIKKIQVK